jgi:hypothetical protein
MDQQYKDAADLAAQASKDAQGDCATLGNLRYFVRQSKSLDLSLSNQI